MNSIHKLLLVAVYLFTGNLLAQCVDPDFESYLCVENEVWPCSFRDVFAVRKFSAGPLYARCKTIVQNYRN